MIYNQKTQIQIKKTQNETHHNVITKDTFKNQP